MINKEESGTVSSASQHFDNLYRMVQYCENKSDCRRGQLLAYLGESNFSRVTCKSTCDNCRDQATLQEEDVTELARLFVNFARQTASSRDKFTLTHYVDVFKGSNNAKVSLAV